MTQPPDFVDPRAGLHASLADRYVIDRELGHGGMAVVYLARDLRHERFVALKTLKPEIAMAVGRERFLREIRLAARLQHPNILPVYDSGEAAGVLYYVMPFVEGESLRDRLEREAQLPLEDALQIAGEVAGALHYAHSHDVVHRDIKPENIMLSGGHAIVADFGIARAISAAGGDKLTETGLAIGTPAYMSPEQAAGTAQMDRRSDIYSLGCVVYEMLAGQPPFTGPTAQAILARHSLDSVPRLKIVREMVPDALEAAINRALAKVPADRHQTAAQFAEALVAASTGTVSPVTATPVRPSGGLPWRMRRPVVVATIVPLVAVLTVGAWIVLAGSGGQGRRSNGGLDPRRVAVLYFTDLSRDSSLDHLAAGLTEGLIGELAQVRDLDVVSANGVAQYRDLEVPRDSIARALRVGSLIAGSVEAVDGQVRTDLHLVDGTSGADLERASFTLPAAELLRMRDSVVHEAARLLRRSLGREVQLRELRAGTASTLAWGLVQRASRAHRDGERAMASGDAAAALASAQQADSLLVLAEQEDPEWSAAPVLRGQVAMLESWARRALDERIASVRQALDHAARALRIAPADPSALALRGTARYRLWRLNANPDPVRRQALLDSAHADLTAAIRADPSLAAAHAVLSQLYYFPPHEDLVAAVLAARAAYEADAYLREAATILDRLFWGSYDLAQFGEARRWCAEGARRFPANWRFIDCQLWLLLVPGADVIPAAAWALAARADSATPGALLPARSRWRQFIVGGALGRIGLRDSAERVFARARTTDRAIDPEQDLTALEAIARAQMGDVDGAMVFLKRYVATHPGHSFQRGGTLHWWWAGLARHPDFISVVRAGR